MSYNFIVGPCDTDSISFCKSDMTSFTREELDNLLIEINNISPEFMVWSDDGYYESCIALRAKNYVLWDPTKVPKKRKSIKGSAFKSASKEPALKQLMDEVVDTLIRYGLNYEELTKIYNKYILEAMNVTDISRWCQKKNITKAILKCKGYEQYTKEELKEKEIRANETSIWDAVKNEEGIQEGDRIYVYPAIIEKRIEYITLKNGKVKEKDDSVYGLQLSKYWNNNHDVEQLIKRILDTIYIFELVLDMKQFTDYTIKKNKHLLEELM